MDHTYLENHRLLAPLVPFQLFLAPLELQISRLGWEDPKDAILRSDTGPVNPSCSLTQKRKAKEGKGQGGEWICGRSKESKSKRGHTREQMLQLHAWTTVKGPGRSTV